MRKTKIIATVGPACEDYKVLKQMVLNGVNVLRINFSHANEESNNILMANVNRLRKDLRIPLPVMIDTRGPELRVLKFKGGSVQIEKGQKFKFVAEKLLGDEEHVSLSFPEVISSIKAGDKILASDGLLTFKVQKVTKTEIVSIAQNSGELANNKSLFIPNVDLKTEYLNKKDKKDITWAIKHNVELIAISFVNSKQDVLDVKEFIASKKGNMKIISKIESARGLKNLDEIMEVSDGIMVARGDLGVEVEIEKLPEIQKKMIEEANKKGLPIITATEMLESMIENNRPTRAEVSDVANAVYDGTSAVMLSAETAIGNYPAEACKMMLEIIKETENSMDYEKNFNNKILKNPSVVDIISNSSVSASFALKSNSIMTFTKSGKTASLISRFKPRANILAATPNEATYRQMELLWGVTPIISPTYQDIDEMLLIANVILKKFGKAKVNDKVVICFGDSKLDDGTNLIKIHEVK